MASEGLYFKGLWEFGGNMFAGFCFTSLVTEFVGWPLDDRERERMRERENEEREREINRQIERQIDASGVDQTFAKISQSSNDRLTVR